MVSEIDSLTPSVLCVAEAVGISGREDMPGHLYFCRNPKHKIPVPPEQECARQVLEDFSSVLRISLQQDDPDRFKEFFYRLFTLAQATFDPIGFNNGALNDLPTFKREVVQVAGASIKAKYTARLTKAVLIGSALILFSTGIIEFATSFFMNNATNLTGVQMDESTSAIPVTNTGAISFSLFNIGIVIAASFVGLLFASMTRSIEPTFETLLTPDADLMQPWVRLVFYGIAVLVIALLFQTEVVAITFGSKVSTSQISNNKVICALIGLLLGIAERALPAEVSQWSKRFLPSSQAHSIP